MTPVQPKLSDLLTRFLDRQAEAQALGLVEFDASEVLPYDAGPVQPIDAKSAWEEALAVLHWNSAVTKPRKTPPHWAQLVAQHEPVVALAFAVGNFPQLMRNFHQLLHSANVTTFVPSAGRPVNAPSLLEWADAVEKKPTVSDAVVLLGSLRLAKQFEVGQKLIKAVESIVTADARGLWQNEVAAFLWHQGKTAEAQKLWESAETIVPVRFNRGMSALFTGKLDAARTLLEPVVQELPETSAWHHLARLYLTLAQTAQ